MIGRQLDLFGGAPKPPKNIVIEDEPPVAEPELTSQVQQEKEGIAEEVEAETETPAPLPEAGVHVQMPSNDAENQSFIVGEVSFPEEPNEESEEAILTGEDIQFEAPINVEPPVADLHEPEWVGSELPDSEPEMDFTGLPAEEESFSNTAEPVQAIGDEAAGMDSPALDPSEEPAMEEVHDDAEAGPLNIPADQALYSRQYYTMRETANMFNVNQSLLRFWENEFDILKPKKNRKGDRYFRPDDIKSLELIYHLLRVRKFTISGAKDYLKNRTKSLDTFAMVQRLEKLKLFLQEIKTHA